MMNDTGYTLSQCKSDMVKMWAWLAENPEKDKEDFIEILRGEEEEHFNNLINHCACCHYAGVDDCNGDPICEDCPAVWNKDDPNRENRCYADGGPYDMWSRWVYGDIEESERYAKKILEIAKQIKAGAVPVQGE